MFAKESTRKHFIEVLTMRILVAASTGIYDAAYPETRKGNTGFGHMVRAIAVMLATEENEVDVLTQSNFTNGRKIGRATLYKKKYSDLFRHFKPFYFFKAIGHAFRREYRLGLKARVFLYCMTGSYCEYLIRKNKYDVVHINGIGVSSLPFLYACARTNTPYVLTLHGLISFDESVHTDRFSKNLEKAFVLEMKKNPDMLCTVISSGIKKRIVNFCGAEDIPGIRVVCNPIIETSETPAPVKKESKYVIVVIGNVTEGKNQRLVVDSFRILRPEIREQSRLYIIGGNENSLREYVEKEKVENVVFTGSVSRGTVNAYLDIADLCVVAAVNEGFGLSIVEAYSHGVPVVMPDGIDAFDDVFEDCSAAVAKEYTPECFAETIASALKKSWNKDEILEVGKRFTMASRSEKYLSVLSEAATKHSCSLTVDEVSEIDEKAKRNDH